MVGKYPYLAEPYIALAAMMDKKEKVSVSVCMRVCVCNLTVFDCIDVVTVDGFTSPPC